MVGVEGFFFGQGKKKERKKEVFCCLMTIISILIYNNLNYSCKDFFNKKWRMLNSALRTMVKQPK